MGTQKKEDFKFWVWVMSLKSKLTNLNSWLILKTQKTFIFVFTHAWLLYNLTIKLHLNRKKIGLANLEECLLLNEDVTNDFISTQHGCPGKKKIEQDKKFYIIIYYL